MAYDDAINSIQAPTLNYKRGLLDYLSLGSDALAGSTDSYGGLLNPQQQRAIDSQRKMAMAAALLEASGPSPNRTSLTQALGRSMGAANQAGAAGVDQALQSALLRKQLQNASTNQFGSVPIDKFEPASIEKYKKTGNYADLIPIKEESKEHGDVTRYKYFNTLTPEEQQKFLLTQRAPVTDRLTEINGVQSFANPVTHRVTPLSTLDAEAAARERLKQAEAAGSAFGKASGEIAAGIVKKGVDAKSVTDVLDRADGLIDIATGSGAGAVRDKFVGWFGYAPEPAQAAAELKVLQANLMLTQPRMEGPQSDSDKIMYQEAAGQIGDPNTPAPVKKAAMRTIRHMQEKYMERAAAITGPQSAVAPSGNTAPTRPPLSSFKGKQ